MVHYSFLYFVIMLVCKKVGGFDGTSGLNSAEVFDISNQEWRMIANMSTRRSSVGVGVLNNFLYAVQHNFILFIYLYFLIWRNIFL